MNTQQRIDTIAEALRDIYRNTNEGPRLIAEMFEREFPDSCQFLSDPEKIEELEFDLNYCRERISDLTGEVADLEAENDKLRRTIAELEDEAAERV